MSVPEPASLLDWMTQLVADPAAAARFTADPRAALTAQGLADLDPADLAHAMPLVTDSVAARFHTIVSAPTPPALLAGEGVLDALVRQVVSVPGLVVAAAPDLDVPDDWTESLIDDLAGAPDGLEGVVEAAPGVDVDLDGIGDLDGVVHDHDLDLMTRLDVTHDLDGAPVTAPAAAPTLALVPPDPPVGNDDPGDESGDEAARTGPDDLDGHARTEDLDHDGPEPHELLPEHDPHDAPDLDVAP